MARDLTPGDIVRVRGEGAQDFVYLRSSTSSTGNVSITVQGVDGRERGRFRSYRPERIKRTRRRLEA